MGVAIVADEECVPPPRRGRKGAKNGRKNRNSQLFRRRTCAPELKVYPKEAPHGAAKCIGTQSRARPSRGVKIEKQFFGEPKFSKVKYSPLILTLRTHATTGGPGGVPPAGVRGQRPRSMVDTFGKQGCVLGLRSHPERSGGSGQEGRASNPRQSGETQNNTNGHTNTCNFQKTQRKCVPFLQNRGVTPFCKVPDPPFWFISKRGSGNFIHFTSIFKGSNR